MLNRINKSVHGARQSGNRVSLRALVRRRRPSTARGFTFIEMIVVISIIIILMAVGIPNYNRTVIQSRESVLRSNLSTLRSVISQYTLDKQKAPQSLDDLVTASYLRQLPADPMTRQTKIGRA